MGEAKHRPPPYKRPLGPLPQYIKDRNWKEADQLLRYIFSRDFAGAKALLIRSRGRDYVASGMFDRLIFAIDDMGQYHKRAMRRAKPQTLKAIQKRKDWRQSWVK